MSGENVYFFIVFNAIMVLTAKYKDRGVIIIANNLLLKVEVKKALLIVGLELDNKISDAIWLRHKECKSLLF